MKGYNKYDDSYLDRLAYKDVYSMMGGMMTQAFSTDKGVKEKKQFKRNAPERCSNDINN